MIRLVLADDQALVREALGALLTLEGDLEVVGYAATSAQAVEAAVSLQPDVCLLDIEMPTGSGPNPATGGFTALEAITAQRPDIACIMLTTFERPGYLRRAIEAGARGFLVKNSPAQELAAAIRRVAGGGSAIDPVIAQESLLIGPNPLTPREMEVLGLVLTGAPAGDIARALFLSAGTVRNHLSSVIAKTGTQNRYEAAQKARDLGWL